MSIYKERLLNAIRAMKTAEEIDRTRIQAEQFMAHASAGEKQEVRQSIRERAKAIRAECNLVRMQALAKLSPRQQQAVMARLM